MGQIPPPLPRVPHPFFGIETQVADFYTPTSGLIHNNGGFKKGGTSHVWVKDPARCRYCGTQTRTTRCASCGAPQ